jgi:hypothetical protein
MVLEMKDISEMKEFEKYGDLFRQVRHNPETGWWLYRRGTSYEVVKGVKHKNPDGTIVRTYPGSETWGTYGYTVCDCSWAEAVIDFIMSAPSRTAQELYEFKKTLKTPAI